MSNNTFLENTIISLTSFPARINTIHICIKSLLNQTAKAEKIVLWLTEEEFPNKEKDLPRKLLSLTNHGLTIEWCHNLRSYNKLIPSLKKYPNKIIITFDDDTIYNKKAVELLFNCHRMHPNDIISHRVYSKYFDDNDELINYPGQLYYDTQYKRNMTLPMLREASFFNRLMGVGGVLYPPGCLHGEVLNEENLLGLAPTQDDIWFWLQAVHNNTKILVPDIHFHNQKSIPTTQNTGLTLINESDTVQITNILNAYPAIRAILKTENAQNIAKINAIIQENCYPVMNSKPQLFNLILNKIKDKLIILLN